MIEVKDVITDVKRLLIDEGADPRFTDDDWRSFLNDAPAAILGLKPSARSEHKQKALTTGALQTLDADEVYLLQVLYNVDSEGVIGKAPREISRPELDLFLPGWQAKTPTTAVVHVMRNNDDPKRFYVYPPNDGEGVLEVLVASLPDPIADGENLDAAELDFPVEFREALLYYLAYRATDVDGDQGANAERSQMFWQKFASLLGVQVQSSRKKTRRERGEDNA